MACGMACGMACETAQRVTRRVTQRVTLTLVYTECRRGRVTVAGARANFRRQRQTHHSIAHKALWLPLPVAGSVLGIGANAIQHMRNLVARHHHEQKTSHVPQPLRP
jgi:hypothetical protein